MQHMVQGAEPHEDADSVHVRLGNDRQQRENVVTVEDPEDRKLEDRHYQDTINSGVQVLVWFDSLRMHGDNKLLQRSRLGAPGEAKLRRQMPPSWLLFN